MQKINLRDLYPDTYKTDVFVDVTEEVRPRSGARSRAMRPMSAGSTGTGPLLSEPGGWH